MLKSPRLWAGTAATLIFLALLLRQTDFDHLREALAGASLWWLLPAMVAYFPGVWCRSVRWSALLAPVRRVAPSRLYPIVLIGYMVNNLVPLRAGELARAALLRRNEGVPPMAGLATIAVERVTDGLALLLLLAVAGLAAPVDQQIAGLLRGASVAFLGVLAAALAVTLAERQTLALLARLASMLPKRLHTPAAMALVHLESALTGLRAFRSMRASLTVAAWALATWIAELAVFYVVAMAFGLQPSLATLTLAMAAANLATSIPATQAGIGPFEYFCAQALMLSGMPSGAAVAYALAVHAALILPVVLAGWWCLWRQGLDFAAVLRPAPTAGQ